MTTKRRVISALLFVPVVLSWIYPGPLTVVGGLCMLTILYVKYW